MNKLPQYDLDGLGGEFKLTEELERSIADFLGVKHCVMVNSGTTAIFLALRATGAKKVAIPPLTMMGTAAAADLAGCEIVFVSNNELPADVDTYVHVSLNGRGCGIDDLMVSHPGVTLIEDACQSFGSKHKGKYLGTFGKVGCFSFSPHKILSAGNGGCVVTDDDDIARKVRRLKNFGRETGGSDRHDYMGYNFKFTDLQAAFVLKQFAEIDERLRRKREIFDLYYTRLSHIMRPHEGTPWFMDIYVGDRDGLMAHLDKRGIVTRAMYPLLTEHAPFAKYVIHGDSSKDSSYSKRGLWLPSSFSLTETEINRVAEAIKERVLA